MIENWDVARPVGICASTGAKIAEGEEFYAVLYEDTGVLRREDYSLAAWKGEPAGSFCAFKTRLPVRERKKRLLVDDELLVNFFERLDGEMDSARLNFRFVLALILMRKRLLRYEETVQDETGQEFWQMRLVKQQSLHRILNPRLDEEQIAAVSGQLSAVIQGAEEAFDVPDGALSSEV